MRDALAALLLTVALLLVPVPHAAAREPVAQQAAGQHAVSTPDVVTEGEVVTRHAITVGGERIEYTATAGHLPLTDDAGKLQAKIFFVAYVRQDGDPERARPVTFAFNGGPGASSLWLHLGIGPKRVDVTVDDRGRASSTPLVDNEATWLGFTDLVFVDPVGTGYSRAAPGVDEREFYEVVRDVEATAGFVQRWLTRYQRWLSPKFIAGESYGSTRAAALADRLQDRAAIHVNGLMLISSVLDFQTIDFRPPNDLAFALAVPSYAATAWYHGKLGGDLDRIIEEAGQWAIGEYLVALAKGDALPEAERRRIAERLAHYTGIDRDELLKRNLRIAPTSFGLQVLRAAGKMTGRFDSRITAADTYRGTRRDQFDPSFYPVTSARAEALNDYLRRDLQYRSSMRYETLSREANRGWKWGERSGYLYVADDLADAIVRDPGLRVLVAAGYYDLATPYLAQKYTVEHMELDAALRGNVRFAGYRAGHQIYDDAEAAAVLKADAGKLVRCALGQDCE